MSTFDQKHERVEVKHYWEIPKYLLENSFVPRDPFGPIKFDAYEWLQRLTVVEAELLQRIGQIEHHLEVDAPAGRAFIRLQQRPDAGNAIQQQVGEMVGRLTDRVQALEGRLAKAGEPPRG